MKKKTITKIFSLILCLCIALFSFAGCGEGSVGGSGEDNSEPSFLSGVKVLTRPENYDFDAALGVYSTNYFNILSKWILDYLYKTYGIVDIQDSQKEGILGGYGTNEKPYLVSYNGLDNRAYMIDSTRYTITSVTEIDTNNKQTVTIDTSAKWNWSIWSIKFYATDLDATDLKAYFYKSAFYGHGLSASDMTSDGKVVFTFDYNPGQLSFDNWTDVLRNDIIPNYSSSYFENGKEDKSEGITDYYHSPYYSNEYSPDYPGDDGTFKNYFQDALEYAIYLISLGYTVEDDADYFDFSISYDENGLVSGMTVGGWESNKISVSDKNNGALKRAREKYEKQTNFVGLQQTIIDEIVKFINKVVIGENATKYENEYYEVNTGLKYYAVETGYVTIIRDYENVVKNIVNYACQQAPIGKDKDGNKVTLSNFFLTSKITDYSGDYFGIRLETDENGEYDDSNLFGNIDAAEYQSIVLFPQEEDIGKRLTDVWIIFEYYDLESGSTRVIDQENGITINVGIRYFNSQTKQIVELAAKQITVGYGKNGETEDKPLTMICFGEDKNGVDVQFENSVVINTGFNNDIGDGVINASENGTVDGDANFKKTLPITAANKDYFKLNDSSSYGQYGTLNEDMFKDEDGCDFVEIYFDIVKDKNNTNKSYAFKVGTTIYFKDSNI